MLPCLLALALLPGALASQEPTISAAKLRVEVTDEPAGTRVARVRLEYRVELDPGRSELPLRALAFAGARPADVRAWVNDTPAAVRIQAGESGRIGAVVALPPELGTDLRLRLDYRLTHDADSAYGISVPLFVPLARPSGAPDGFFTAVLRLPSDHSILESFPVLPSPTLQEQNAVWNLRLQAVPAVLRWRGQVGEAPFIRFGRMVDIGALLVLLVGGAGAVRILVHQQREPA